MPQASGRRERPSATGPVAGAPTRCRPRLSRPLLVADAAERVQMGAPKTPRAEALTVEPSARTQSLGLERGSRKILVPLVTKARKLWPTLELSGLRPLITLLTVIATRSNAGPYGAKAVAPK